MRDDIKVLARCPLFAKTTEAQIESMVDCLSAKRRDFSAKSMIYPQGTEAYQLGIVLCGDVDVIQEDFWGNQNMVARLTPGQLFAESFALAQISRLPVSVMTHRDSSVLLLDYRRILHTCENTCPHHERLIANLLAIVAQKNVYLTQKMDIVTKKTIRDRLIAYLSIEAKRANSPRFSLPYDRQALADYLSVDRSALSRTLGEMRAEGLLDFSKNIFELKDTQ